MLREGKSNILIESAQAEEHLTLLIVIGFLWIVCALAIDPPSKP